MPGKIFAFLHSLLHIAPHHLAAHGLRCLLPAVYLASGLTALLPPTPTPQPVAYAVLFTSPPCTFCSHIVDDELPPAIERFGSQLQILYVDVNTPAGGALYQAAFEAFGVQRGVPQIYIGQTMLGGVNIVPQLPQLVDTYLAQGGVEWPPIPGLEAYLAASLATQTPDASQLQATAPPPDLLPASQGIGAAPVVRLIMFWMADCSHCHYILDEVLPPLQAQYQQQLDILLIEIKTPEEIDRFYQLGAAFGLAKDAIGVPFLVIGDRALVGTTQIPAELPGLIETYLAQGGVGYPDLPVLSEMLPTPTPPAGQSASDICSPFSTPCPTLTPSAPLAFSPPDGFWLAVGALVFMVAALLYTLLALLWKSLPAFTGRWAHIALPILALVGLGIAAYLAYVETQSVSAMCGPVGDCNAVQASPYARLFGVLPVGVLGVLGYLSILTAWGWSRLRRGLLARFAPLVIFGMSIFGVLFSIYLTYLEAFVIRAVCVWCVSSALLMTLLMLLALSPVRPVPPR